MLPCSSAAQKTALLLQGQQLPHVESSTRLARHRGRLEGLPGAGTPGGVGRDRWEMGSASCHVAGSSHQKPAPAATLPGEGCVRGA